MSERDLQTLKLCKQLVKIFPVSVLLSRICIRVSRLLSFLTDRQTDRLCKHILPIIVPCLQLTSMCSTLYIRVTLEEGSPFWPHAVNIGNLPTGSRTGVRSQRPALHHKFHTTLHIQFQFLRHKEHRPSPLQRRVMMFTEIIGIYSETNKKHLKTICEQYP